MNNQRYNYNPDILETIANLSNDEVFTPPKLANQILDMLPNEIWSNSSLKFLDPAVKTGIFLREITSRLIEGLADEIPDLQERVNHILTNQVYGVGITELTTLMARRTVYCSTTANGKYSICTEFDNEEGNIVFPDTEHTFNEKTGRCEDCGASKEGYENVDGMENYAYPFIHRDFEEVFDGMKFDVIIGNPPYQMSVGNEGANSSYAVAIYHLFVNKAIELKPKYISMIIPSRWMTNAAEGISAEWTKKIISDKRIKEINDYENANEVFPTVEINGGVNYFLWDANHEGPCKYTYNYKDGSSNVIEKDLKSIDSDVIIRDPIAQSVVNKVEEKHPKYQFNESLNFSNLVATYGLGRNLSTSWRGYKDKKTDSENIKYYVSKATNGAPYGWISKSEIDRNLHVILSRKIFIPRAHGGEMSVLGVPRYGEPGSVASSTYVIIGADQKLSSEEIMNIMSYISTKFFRFMVKVLKSTQGATKRVYRYVPMQEWNNKWTDEELYKKYELTEDQINHIEDSIYKMDIAEELNLIEDIKNTEDVNY